MLKKDAHINELTKQFIGNHPPVKINESLLELYFSFASLTSDYPVNFQFISSDIYGLIKFINELEKINNEGEAARETRGRKKKDD